MIKIICFDLNLHYWYQPGFSWWRHQMETFSRYWPFVRGNHRVTWNLRGIHRSPVNSSHKGLWRFFLCFLWSAPWINGWGWWSETRSIWRHCNVGQKVTRLASMTKLHSFVFYDDNSVFDVNNNVILMKQYVVITTKSSDEDDYIFI